MMAHYSEGWERPFNIRSIEDAFLDIIRKIEDESWGEFARRALEVDEGIVQSIENNETDWHIKKYKICLAWRDQYDSLATIERLYHSVNHYLHPDRVTKSTENLQPSPTTDQDACQYCSRVGRIAIAQPTDDTAKPKMLSRYNNCFGKGKVIIINNNFKNSDTLKPRIGSKVDVDSMSELWHKLGCDIIVKEDKSVEEIKQELMAFNKNVEGNDYLVIIIMSHGGKDDKIYGENGEALPLKEITDIFSYENSPYTGEMPKVFFFQCSRGSKFSKTSSLDNSCGSQIGSLVRSLNSSSSCDAEHIQTYSEEDDNDNKASPTEMTEALNTTQLSAQLQEVANLQDARSTNSQQLSYTMEGSWETDHALSEPNGARDSTASQHQRIMLPPLSDMLISHSTAPGHSSFRDPKNGSWYINAIANIFQKYATTEHVVDLVIKVNEAVSARSMKSDDYETNGAHCTPQFECTLRENLYLTLQM